MLYTLLSRALCVWCCLLLCGAQEDEDTSQFETSRSESVLGDGEEEVTGKSSISTFRRFRLVCGTSVAHYQGLLSHTELSEVYSGFKKDLQEKRVEHFFHQKIVPNHRGSVCQNLNVTCCKSSMEKMSETLSRNEFMFYYDEIFHSHSQTCRSPGKSFHKSSFLVIRQLEQELEARVNFSLGTTLPPDTFRDLSNFLASFSSVPDICRLPDLLDSQTEVLIDLMLASMLGGDEEYSHILGDRESMRCARNISSSLIVKQKRRLLADLQKHLLDLRLLSQALELAEETIETVRHYSLSQSCITALTRMRYCPLCGGYTKFKPCLFLCINTLRGCFADLAEIQPDFIGLISASRILSEDIIKEMGPETFERSYFNHFVLMMQELREKEDELKDTLVLECVNPEHNRTNSTNTLTRKRRGGSLIQTIQGSKSRPKQDPLLEQLDPEVLATVVELEMGCLERVADKMKDAADDVCFVSKYDVAHKGNSQCWTGSILGRYDHPKVGFMKADQLKNPEYADIPFTIELRYSKLINALHTMTRKINTTIAFNKVCLDSDDEDCFRNPFQNCGRRNTEETVSGSGSGSGSGSDSGINETATEYDRGGVTTTRPTTASTVRSTAMTIPSDNSLRDEMVPSTPGTTSTGGRERDHEDPGNKNLPGAGDFDNNIPLGSEKDRITIPDRKPLEPLGGENPSKSTVGNPGTATADMSAGMTTTTTAGTTTAGTTTTGATTTGTTAADGDINQRERTPASTQPTTTADAAIIEENNEAPVISSSASPHLTPILTTALVTCMTLSILH